MSWQSQYFNPYNYNNYFFNPYAYNPYAFPLPNPPMAPVNPPKLPPPTSKLQSNTFVIKEYIQPGSLPPPPSKLNQVAVQAIKHEPEPLQDSTLASSTSFEKMPPLLDESQVEKIIIPKAKKSSSKTKKVALYICQICKEENREKFRFQPKAHLDRHIVMKH